MTSHKTIKLLACLILALATLRVLGFWAADPMLAYGNNYDQIRTMETFGFRPRDSQKEPFVATPEQPWRYFIKSAEMRWPSYPSSDQILKAIQYATMVLFAADDGSMDIKIASAPLLLGWMLGIWLIFKRLLISPANALGFAAWLLVVVDPINLLFLNTWYAEFSAFAVTTLLIGLVWLWMLDLIGLRPTLLWGAMCLLFLSLNRNQYMFLLPTVALLIAAAMAVTRPYRRQLTGSPIKVVLVAVLCLLPALVYTSAAQKMYPIGAANRINTVFFTLLPASQNPARMAQKMRLPPSCLQFSGRNWYDTPTTAFETHCPQVMRLPLSKVVKGVISEPLVVFTIIEHVGKTYRGFLLPLLGQIEGRANAQLQDSSSRLHRSINPLFKRLAPDAITALILVASLGPVLAALIAWSVRQRRWSFMFLLCGLLFNYALFSSLFGDGYADLDRHAILCFSFGALFFVLLACFAASAFQRAPAQNLHETAV
ncbi:hypothetical protein [Ottowia sp.]|uniref:glycan biosynthesis hexose transferase WsfD n=1 Tax=Ottowia sp. TaxID=1898956 RepID=UPI003A87EE23